MLYSLMKDHNENTITLFFIRIYLSFYFSKGSEVDPKGKRDRESRTDRGLWHKLAKDCYIDPIFLNTLYHIQGPT